MRLDAQKHIDIAINSAYGSGREGRVKRKRMKAGAGGAADNDEDED